MEKLKNSLLLLIILSLVTTAMISASPVYANSTTALSVTFPNGTNSSINEYFPPDEVTVNINVADVTTLFVFDFTVIYDTAVLTANAPVTLGDFFPGDSIIWVEEINNDLGYVRYLVSLPPGIHEGVSGSGTLATISFTVAGSGATVLALSDTKFSNDQMPPEYIAHKAISGLFSNVGAIQVALYDWELKVNNAAGIGKGHKSTVGVANDLKANVLNTGIDVYVQVCFEVTDSAGALVDAPKSGIVLVPAGTTATPSATWTADKPGVYKITAYLSYGPSSLLPLLPDGSSKTLTLRVDAHP